MKRLSWTLGATLTGSLCLTACGEKGDDPAGTAETSDSTTSDGTTSDSTTTSSTTTDSTSDSTTSTTTSGTTTDTDTGTFIDPPDGGVVGQCDPGLQDCPNPDDKCTGYVTMPGDCCVDSNHCVPVTGNRQFGEECTRVDGDDDCAAGLFCMTKTSGSTGTGICLEYCVVGDAASCENGGECFAFNDGALPMCQTLCDPLLQDCGPNQGCYAAFDQFICAMPGFEAGEGGDGSACYTIQSCEPGLGCVSADVLDGCADTACCTPFCDLSEADPCTAPEACESWFEEGQAPPQYADVGACTIPQ